jgi:hypothetical protein
MITRILAFFGYRLARLADDRSRYDGILAEGEALNPLAPRSGKRGQTRQSKPPHLVMTANISSQ